MFACSPCAVSARRNVVRRKTRREARNKVVENCRGKCAAENVLCDRKMHRASKIKKARNDAVCVPAVTGR